MSSRRKAKNAKKELQRKKQEALEQLTHNKLNRLVPPITETAPAPKKHQRGAATFLTLGLAAEAEHQERLKKLKK